MQGRLQQAEADAAALRRMVRLLKSGGGSAAPSPALSPALADAGPDDGEASGSAAWPANGLRRRRWEGKVDSEAEQSLCEDAALADGEDSCRALSSSPSLQRGKQGASGAPAAATAAGSAFLEEQVQSLAAALRRVQRRNRELAAQLAAASAGPSGGSTVGDQLVLVQQQQLQQHEVSGLAAENAALRRQAEEAEAEAGRAQWELHRQQAEARALHSQVVEVRCERCLGVPLQGESEDPAPCVCATDCSVLQSALLPALSCCRLCVIAGDGCAERCRPGPTAAAAVALTYIRR